MCRVRGVVMARERRKRDSDEFGDNRPAEALVVGGGRWRGSCNK